MRITTAQRAALIRLLKVAVSAAVPILLVALTAGDDLDSTVWSAAGTAAIAAVWKFLDWSDSPPPPQV